MLNATFKEELFFVSFLTVFCFIFMKDVLTFQQQVPLFSGSFFQLEPLSCFWLRGSFAVAATKASPPYLSRTLPLRHRYSKLALYYFDSSVLCVLSDICSKRRRTHSLNVIKLFNTSMWNLHGVWKLQKKSQFNMASKASYVYILSGQKLIINDKASFWKLEAGGQTVLPDRSLLGMECVS